MPYQYNPTGALNGLFAPAYIAGNPESETAVTNWNTNRQTQLHPTPPVTPPTTPPVTPPTGIPGDFFSRLPPIAQARWASVGRSFPGQPAPLIMTNPDGSQSGSAGPMPQLPSVRPDNQMTTRDNIAQMLMFRR